MNAQLIEYRNKQREKYCMKRIQSKKTNNKQTQNVVINTNGITVQVHQSQSQISDYSESDSCSSSDYDSDYVIDTTINTHTINKYKKKTIPSTVKRLVWNMYIGEHIGKSKCYCCQLSDITQLSFHCGHVVSEKNGGKINIDNLRPICQNCNSSMGTANMNEFIIKYNLHSNP